MTIETYVSLEDARELTGCSYSFLSRLARKGDVKVQRRDGRQEIRWSDLKKVVKMVEIPDRLVDREVFEMQEPPSGLLIHGPDSPPKMDRSQLENRLEVGDCRSWMRKIPQLFQTVVTSPPYWGVRRYPGQQEVEWFDGTKVALGNEPNPEGYIRHTLEILRQIKTVLKDDGIIWWNLGDTYFTRAVIRESTVERLDAYESRRSDTWREYPLKRYSSGHTYLKDKDLTLIPFRVALGAQYLGFWVRSIVIWSKPNIMPEPIKDRPTTAHEYLLMLTKSKHYYYNTEAAREPAVTEAILRKNGKVTLTDKRNLRTVWSFAVDVNHLNHTAAFPIELPTRCILASTQPGDLVFDPFLGSGQTAIAADRIGRLFFGCDICSEYIAEATKRIETDRLERKSSEAVPETGTDVGAHEEQHKKTFSSVQTRL